MEARVSPPSAEEAAKVAAFRAALRRFSHESERVARACGLTPQWYVIMLLVKGAPDLSERATVTDLAKRLSLAQSSVTELVHRAEAAGLIRSEPSGRDARVRFLRLTPEGERRFAEAFRNLAAERRALRDAVEELED